MLLREREREEGLLLDSGRRARLAQRVQKRVSSAADDEQQSQDLEVAKAARVQVPRCFKAQSAKLRPSLSFAFLISRLHLFLPTMRLQHLTPFLLVGAALAAPPPFVLQGSQQLNLPANEAELPHLTSDQFLDIERAKVKAEQVMQSLVDRLEQAATEMEEDVAQRVQEEIEAASGGAADDAAGLPPHRPPPVLDFSDYTILEILNASLHHHPEHDHKADVDAAELPKWKLPWSPKQPQHHPGGGEHEHDPKYLPLHRLGWFVNQSEEAQKVLGKGEFAARADGEPELRDLS